MKNTIRKRSKRNRPESKVNTRARVSSRHLSSVLLPQHTNVSRKNRLSKRNRNKSVRQRKWLTRRIGGMLKRFRTGDSATKKNTFSKFGSSIGSSLKNNKIVISASSAFSKAKTDANDFKKKIKTSSLLSFGKKDSVIPKISTQLKKENNTSPPRAVITEKETTGIMGTGTSTAGVAIAGTGTGTGAVKTEEAVIKETTGTGTGPETGTETGTSTAGTVTKDSIGDAAGAGAGAGTGTTGTVAGAEKKEDNDPTVKKKDRTPNENPESSMQLLTKLCGREDIQKLIGALSNYLKQHTSSNNLGNTLAKTGKNITRGVFGKVGSSFTSFLTKPKNKKVVSNTADVATTADAADANANASINTYNNIMK